jgi:hypothetical protein
MKVDARAILRAGVVALPVQRGRVVDHEEDLEHLAQRDLRRIELHAHHLGMAGGATAHLFVAWVPDRAVAVARLHGDDPLHALVNRLGAPEAAAAQGDGFDGWVHAILQCLFVEVRIVGREPPQRGGLADHSPKLDLHSLRFAAPAQGRSLTSI